DSQVPEYASLRKLQVYLCIHEVFQLICVFRDWLFDATILFIDKLCPNLLPVGGRVFVGATATDGAIERFG
ncbi:hypothetical protein N9F76_00930, partial [bacterium]|nr:hypothetical protein [bacterium]